MKQKIKLKKCKNCGIRKAWCEFRKYDKGKDGHYYYCKNCEREYKHQWYLKNREKMNTRNREWIEKNKDRMTFLKKKWKKKCYDKVYAKELFQQRDYELLNDYFSGCSFVFTSIRKAVAIPKWVEEMCYNPDDRIYMKRLIRYYGNFENMLKNRPSKMKKKTETPYKQFRSELREMLMPRENDSDRVRSNKKRLRKALRL